MRVVQDVEKDLLKLVEITHDRRDLGAERGPNLDPVDPQLIRQERKDRRENGVDVDERALRAVLAREGEEVLDDPLTSLRFRVHDLELRLHRGGSTRALEDLRVS